MDVTEFEEKILHNMNIVMYGLGGVALCCCFMWIKNFCDGVSYVLGTVWYLITCRCCRPRYRPLNSI